MTCNKAILLNGCLILLFPDCPFLEDSRSQWVHHCSDLTVFQPSSSSQIRAGFLCEQTWNSFSPKVSEECVCQENWDKSTQA